MAKMLNQTLDQVPETGDKQNQQNCPSDDIERLPERRPNHRHQKRRQKKRDRRKDCPLTLHVLASVRLEDLIDDAVPTRLRRNVARAGGVRVVRIKNRMTVTLFAEL